MLLSFFLSSWKDGSLEDDSDEDTENEDPDKDYVSVFRFAHKKNTSARASQGIRPDGVTDVLVATSRNAVFTPSLMNIN